MVPVNGSGEPSISPTSPSQRHKGHFARDLALHPISGSAPINKNKRGIRRSIDATITSKLHEGRRRVELNQEMWLFAFEGVGVVGGVGRVVAG